MVLVDSASLRRAYEIFRPRCGRRVEEYFAPAYLMDVFKLSSTQTGEQLCSDPKASGWDAFHFLRAGAELVFLKCIWTSSHLAFREPLSAFTVNGLEAVVRALTMSASDSMEQDLSNALHRGGRKPIKLRYQLTFLGDPEAAENSEGLQSVLGDLTRKRDRLRELGRGASLDVVFESSGVKSIPKRLLRSQTASFKVRSSTWLRREATNGEVLHLGFIRLAELITMHRQLGMELLDQNIRAGLGGKRSLANQALKRLFRDLMSPGEGNLQMATRFPFDHNGVILSVGNLIVDEDGKNTTLIEPRVLNGAQSITSLVEVLDQMERRGLWKPESAWLEKTEVVCKVVLSADRDFIADVTRRANQQNAVEPWDLHANDEIQLWLADRLKSTLGLYYERQRGAFKAYGRAALTEMGYMEVYAPIEMKRFAKTVLALQGRIDMMRRPREVFGRDEPYNSVFNKLLLETDPRALVLCYKLQRRIDEITDELIRGRVGKLGILRWANNAVWALGCALVLASRDREDWLDQYGRQLRGSSALGHQLGRLARNELQPTMINVLRESRLRAVVRGWEAGETEARAIDSPRLYSQALNRLGWQSGYNILKSLSYVPPDNGVPLSLRQ